MILKTYLIVPSFWNFQCSSNGPILRPKYLQTKVSSSIFHNWLSSPVYVLKIKDLGSEAFIVKKNSEVGLLATIWKYESTLGAWWTLQIVGKKVPNLSLSSSFFEKAQFSNRDLLYIWPSHGSITLSTPKHSPKLYYQSQFFLISKSGHEFKFLIELIDLFFWLEFAWTHVLTDSDLRKNWL